MVGSGLRSGGHDAVLVTTPLGAGVGEGKRRGGCVTLSGGRGGAVHIPPKLANTLLNEKKTDPGLSLLFCDVKNWYLIFFPPNNAFNSHGGPEVLRYELLNRDMTVAWAQCGLFCAEGSS